MKIDRSKITVYAVELTLGIVLGLALLVLVLWVLDVSFPESTSLGELARGRGMNRGNSARLDLDGMGQVQVATLTAVRRDVRDRPAFSVVWWEADRGKPLGDRHAVQSFAGSGATITFEGGSTLELEEKSIVVVRKPRRNARTGRRSASVLFMDGFVRARLGGDDPEAAELQFVTAGGIVLPRAGEAGAEIALGLDNQTSSLSVHAGAADIVWGDQTTQVDAGYMVTFDENRAPGQPVALPDAPRARAPRPGASFIYRANPPRVEFSWVPRDDSTEFQLDIARDAGFEDRIYRERLARTSFVHGNLEAGRYYWRVAALRGLVAGPPSKTVSFVVREDPQPPRLDVQFPVGPLDRLELVLRGTTEPGCRVIVGEERVEVDRSGHFAHPLTLQDGYNFLVVQAIDPAGNTAFANQTVVADPAASGSQP